MTPRLRDLNLLTIKPTPRTRTLAHLTTPRLEDPILGNPTPKLELDIRHETWFDIYYR